MHRMRKRTETDADAILAIDAENPEALFSGDDIAVEAEFRRLVMVWHPDRCHDPRATEVTAHIVGLHRLLAARRGDDISAQSRHQAVPWLGPLCIPDPTLRSIETDDGRKRAFRVRLERPFELGSMWVGDSFVLFLVRPDFEDLFENGRRAISALAYADSAMEREMSRHLPVLIECFRTATDELAMVVAKGADDLPMVDVCRLFSGSVDPRHVAWMMSSLHHIACYLTYARTTHNAISPDTCFLSPRRHAVSLLGGWWFSTPSGERLRAMPTWSLHNVPQKIVEMQVGDPRIDLTLIRAVGRYLLGPDGLAKAPAAMRQFLEGPVVQDAFTIYRTWAEHVLQESFGDRRFVDLRLGSDQIYDRG